MRLGRPDYGLVLHGFWNFFNNGIYKQANAWKKLIIRTHCQAVLLFAVVKDRCSLSGTNAGFGSAESVISVVTR